MHVIQEIAEAVSRGRYVLLIKGDAGTGKTTLALQILSDVFKGEGVYVSTRVYPDELYAQFPWLRGKLDPSNVIDATEAVVPPARELDFMRLRLSQDLPGFAEGVYIACREAKARVVVIDSVNAIAELAGGEEALRRLVELSKAMEVSFVMTLEGSGASKLDYLADGVVTLHQECYEGKCLRTLVVEKSRMVERRRPSYIFTLKGSRLRCIRPASLLRMKPDVRSDPREESGEFFTTGFKLLDDALGGGFPRGSYNVIEVSADTSVSASMVLLIPLMRTFIERNRGVLVVLPAGMSSKRFKEDLIDVFGEEKVEKLVRILDFNVKESSDPCIIPRKLDDKRESFSAFEREFEELSRRHGPLLDITTFDIYEQYFGREMSIYNMSKGVTAYREGGHLGIGVIHPELKTVTEQRNMSDVYLRLEYREGFLLLHGVRPWTPLFAIELEREREASRVKLVEVV